MKKLEYSSGNYLVTDPEGMVGRYLLPMLSARTPLSERILFHLAGTDEDHTSIRSGTRKVGCNGIDKLRSVVADFGTTGTTHRTEILAHLYLTESKRTG